MANKQAFWMEEIVSDAHLAALQNTPLEVIAWLVKDLQVWGLGSGLVCSQTSPMSLATKVTAGRVWFADGHHGELAADAQVDLTSHVPGMPGESRWVSIWASASEVSSVPVVTPGGTVNSVLKDVVQLSVSAGAATTGTPVKPAAPDLNSYMLVADVLLTYNMGIIMNAVIFTDRRGTIPDIRGMEDRIQTVEDGLLGKAPMSHVHNIEDITGLQTYLDNHTQSIASIIGLSEILTDLTDGLAGKAALIHDHDSVYHKKTGDEVHTGKFQVTSVPALPQEVVRLMDIEGLLVSDIAIAPGSTIDSGYAFVGNMAFAWVRGASQWGSGSTNPVQTLVTPITFDQVLSYSLSTENADGDASIGDNDFWYQMRTGYAGNQFPVILQCAGGSMGGTMRPVLFVIGTSAAHTPVISNLTPVDVMAISGQTYPKIVTVALAATGCLGGTTWSIESSSGFVTPPAFTAGYTDRIDLTFPALGTYTVTVKVTDGTGAHVSKTLVFNMVAYVASNPIIDTPGSVVNDIADSYDWTTQSPLLTAHAGVAPYVWSIVAGAGGTATNLPSATIANVTGGKAIQGVVTGPGDWYINLRCTDNIGAITDKIVHMYVETYVEPPPPDYCFEAGETYVLMADGSSKLLQEIKAGEYVLTCHERQHEKGGRGLAPSRVTDVALSNCLPDAPHSRVIKGIRSTRNHSWGVVTPVGIKQLGEWTPAQDLDSNMLLATINDDRHFVSEPVGNIETGTPVQVQGNLGTEAHTFMVGATPTGPWFLVHNISSPSY